MEATQSERSATTRACETRSTTHTGIVLDPTTTTDWSPAELVVLATFPAVLPGAGLDPALVWLALLPALVLDDERAVFTSAPGPEDDDLESLSSDSDADAEDVPPLLRVDDEVTYPIACVSSSSSCMSITMSLGGRANTEPDPLGFLPWPSALL